MPRSHPPSLTTCVRRTLLEECGELRGCVVLAAVSGGGDSQAMLSVLARLAPELGFELAAHGVDHGLRPEAAAELQLARELAERLKVPFASTEVSVARGPNLQARARDARYRALRAAAALVAGERRALIATAHHSDDRAETVLLRLMRGAGPRGLAVMPARAQDVIRPLLRAGKRDVQLHLQRHQLLFAKDPSNSDAAFLRVRVRHELLPLFTELSPQIVKHLNALADALCGATLSEPAELGVESSAPQLNRAQIQEVLRARRLGRSVTIRVAGARDLVVRHEKKDQAGIERIARKSGPGATGATSTLKPRRKV